MKYLLPLLLLAAPAYADAPRNWMDPHKRTICDWVQHEVDIAVYESIITEREANRIMINCYNHYHR